MPQYSWTTADVSSMWTGRVQSAVGDGADRRLQERGVQQLVAQAAADSQGAGSIVNVGRLVA